MLAVFDVLSRLEGAGQGASNRAEARKAKGGKRKERDDMFRMKKGAQEKEREEGGEGREVKGKKDWNGQRLGLGGWDEYDRQRREGTGERVKEDGGKRERKCKWHMLDWGLLVLKQCCNFF